MFALVENIGEGGGERNRCTRQRDADRKGSFSFFSPLPLLPSPFVWLPPVYTTVSLSLSLSLSLFLFVSVPLFGRISLRPTKRLARDLSLRACVRAAITARSARLYLERDAGTTGSEGLSIENLRSSGDSPVARDSSDLTKSNHQGSSRSSVSIISLARFNEG